MKDPRNRYSNHEVSDPPQRIEDSDGLAILANNFYADMDEAFQRQVNAIINSPRPEDEGNLTVWAHPVGSCRIQGSVMMEISLYKL